MKIVTTLGVLLLLLFISCNKKNLSPVDLKQWVEEENNGLKISKIIGKVDYILQYKPIDYVIVNEERSHNLNNEKYTNRKRQLDGSTYFNLRMIRADQASGDILQTVANDYKDYLKKQEYLSFDIQNDFFLVSKQDTLPCSIAQYIPNYGISPYVDLVLAFENKASVNNSDLELVYNDKLFGSGTMKFTINNNDINHTPSVITH